MAVELGNKTFCLVVSGHTYKIPYIYIHIILIMALEGFCDISKRSLQLLIYISIQGKKYITFGEF